MCWRSDLAILYDFYGDFGSVAREIQVSVSADWLQRAHREDDVVPSKEITDAITAHANGTDGNRALDSDEAEEEEKTSPERETLSGQHDTRLAEDIDETPRDSM